MITVLVAPLLYLTVGYLVYVPSAVKVETERLIIAWDRGAQEDAERRRKDLRGTQGRWTHYAVRWMDHEALQHREQQLQEDIDRIQATPAPVAQLRRQAARRWPVYCLVWLPLLLAGWSVLAFNAVTSHAASRAPRTSQEIEADNARKAARLAELEAADAAWREANQ